MTLPPAGRLATSLRLPAVGPAVQVPPPAPTQVVLQPLRLAGKVSATVVPGAFDGPAFEAVRV